MNNETENLETTVPEDEEAMLPEGFKEGDTFFPDQGEEGFGEEKQEETPMEEVTDGSEDPQQGEQQVAPEGEAHGEGTQQEEAPAAENLLKFKNGDAEVAVKESDLPGIYQRAQAHDRVNTQFLQLQQSMNRVNAIAQGMGFDSAQAMLDKAAENYREAEVQRLVAEGANEEMARAHVERKMAEAKPQSTQPAQQAAPVRDFRREIAELVQQRPELREQIANGGKLPQEVITACVKNGVPLRVAYAEHEAREVRAEAERIKQENEILKQNAANAAKAPVKSVTAGGSANTKGKDPFLVGFESDN